MSGSKAAALHNYSLFFKPVDGLKPFLLLPRVFTLLSVQPVAMAVVYENFPENRAFANGIYMALGLVLALYQL